MRIRGTALKFGIFAAVSILFIALLGASFVAVTQQFALTARARERVDARGDSSLSVRCQRRRWQPAHLGLRP